MMTRGNSCITLAAVAAIALHGAAARAQSAAVPTTNPGTVPLSPECSSFVSVFCGKQNGEYDFNGVLDVGGEFVSSTAGTTVKGVLMANSPRNALQLSSDNVAVNVSLRYARRDGCAGCGPDYSVSSLTVNSLGVAIKDHVTIFGDGRSGKYSLSSIGSMNRADNSTALAGRYYSTDNSRIEYGTISGTARLLADPGPVTYADGGGTTTVVAPIGLAFQTTSTAMTTLDETGLVTPTVSVSNGIDMHGSRVSNLADAIAPTDAVNLRQLDERVGQLDRRMASATAVAVAMSGNAFLPDMKFNLTANVATYDGAHAGSVQFAALVSRHMAVNAGVARGFNRGGKTAGRVGVTFGW